MHKLRNYALSALTFGALFISLVQADTKVAIGFQIERVPVLGRIRRCWQQFLRHCSCTY